MSVACGIAQVDWTLYFFRPEMIPQKYRSNLPPTDNGRARLLKLYATKEKEIKDLDLAITSDLASIAASKIAISSIEKTIQHSRKALNTYSLNLAAIQDIRKRLENLPGALDLGPTAAEESQSLDVCQRVATFISLNTSKETQPLKEQQISLEKRIADLASMLTSLERELLDWQVDLALSEASVNEIQVCSSNLKPILSEIRRLLSPSRHVPDEIWLQIFHLVHDENLFQRPPLLRTSYILLLSQVCRKWREVALTAPKLWNCIDIVPLLWWTTPEQTYILEAVKRSNGEPMNLFVRLWLQRTWEAQAIASAKRGRLYIHGNASLSPESRYTGSSRSDLSPVDASLIPRPYSLHLHTRSDVRATEKIPESVPFHNPQSLTIQSTFPRASAQLREMTSSFNEVKKLVLVDIWPISVTTAPVNLPNLIYLGLELHSFKPFNILPLLFPTLEELHVVHDGTRAFQYIASPVSLPKLHTISVTLHDYQLCSWLVTPMLRTLILHSSSPLVEPAKALQHLESGGQYERLTSVILNGWSSIDVSPSVLDITKVLFMKSSQLSRLTFNSCHVDGAKLLALLRESIQKSERSSCDASIIKEITISSCTGITQTDCKEIKSQVQKLIVYV